MSALRRILSRPWLWTAVGLTILAAALVSQWQFGLQTTQPLTQFRPVAGHLFIAPANAEPKGGPKIPARLWEAAVLTEEGTPLPLPKAKPLDIQKNGGGRYRLAPSRVLLSSRDGSTPGKNGRSYALEIPAFRVPGWLQILAGTLAALAWTVVLIQLPSVQRARASLRARIKDAAPGDGPLLERLCRRLSPVSYFIGLSLGLLLCVLAGRHAAKIDIYEDRPRFFFQISPEGFVYPTLDNLTTYVRGKAPPDKILVLVGGSSILLGVGQTHEHLWSEQLQRNLGGDFAVVNVSFRSAVFTSIAMPLAEVLAGEYPRMIIVTDTSLAGSAFLHFREGTYRYPYDYILWQAWTTGRLGKNPARDAELHAALRSPSEPLRLHAEEQWIHGVVENATHSSNLWNLIGYRHLFTVDSPITARAIPFFEPRKNLSDDQVGVPKPPPAYALEMPRFQSQLEGTVQIAPDGSMTSTTPVANLATALTASVSPRTFPAKMLFLVPSHSSDYIARLSPENQARAHFRTRTEVQALRDAGFYAISLGLDYPPDHYWDFSHFADPASPRMAQEVAREIKTIATKHSWIP